METLSLNGTDPLFILAGFCIAVIFVALFGIIIKRAIKKARVEQIQATPKPQVIVIKESTPNKSTHCAHCGAKCTTDMLECPKCKAPL